MRQKRADFQLTRAQAKGLARAIRVASSWGAFPDGYEIVVSHRDGTEVSISVLRPRRVEAKVILGFRGDRR